MFCKKVFNVEYTATSEWTSLEKDTAVPHDGVVTASKVADTYRSVIYDDIIVGHVAMENVLFKMLDESALGNGEQKGQTGNWAMNMFIVNMMNHTCGYSARTSV